MEITEPRRLDDLVAGLDEIPEAMAAYRAGLQKHPDDPALNAALAELLDVPAP